MKKYFLSAVLLAIFLVSGCANKVDLGPGYQRISKNFLQAMRWKDFQGAAAYLSMDNRPKLLADFDGLKDLNIVDAEYQYSDMDKKTGTARSELKLTYYLLPSVRVKEWRWKQDWVLIPVDSKQRGTWQLLGTPPTFP